MDLLLFIAGFLLVAVISLLLIAVVILSVYRYYDDKAFEVNFLIKRIN